MKLNALWKATFVLVNALLVLGDLPAQTQISPASIPAPQAVRVRGTISSVDGTSLVIKARTGEILHINVPDSLDVTEVYPIRLDMIQPNSFLGTTALPAADGKLRALEVHVFPESQRGTGEGHRPMDFMPESTMTNATVVNVVTGVQGREFKLQYKGGEKTVVVPENTPIVTYRPGDRSLFKPGADISLGVIQAADGQLKATRVTVGRDGFVAPM